MRHRVKSGNDCATRPTETQAAVALLRDEQMPPATSSAHALESTNEPQTSRNGEMVMTTRVTSPDQVAAGRGHAAQPVDDVGPLATRLIQASPSVSSRSKRRDRTHSSGNNSTGLSGRGRPRHLSWARSPDRLKAWTNFTSQLSELQRKRIKADEARRQTRSKRNSASETFKTLATLMHEEAGQATGPPLKWLGILQSLSHDLTELDAMESRLEAFEEELVSAEFALSRTLPKIEGSEVEKTRQMLKQNQLSFREGSYSSGESGRSDPELNSEYQNKLAIVNDVEQQVLDLQAQEMAVRETDPADLDAGSLAFLQVYPQENRRLLDELTAAMSELEQLRDKLHPTQPSDDCFPGPMSDERDIDEVNSSGYPVHTGFEDPRLSNELSTMGK